MLFPSTRTSPSIRSCALVKYSNCKSGAAELALSFPEVYSPWPFYEVYSWALAFPWNSSAVYWLIEIRNQITRSNSQVWVPLKQMLPERCRIGIKKTSLLQWGTTVLKLSAKKTCTGFNDSEMRFLSSPSIPQMKCHSCPSEYRLQGLGGLEVSICAHLQLCCVAANLPRKKKPLVEVKKKKKEEEFVHVWSVDSSVILSTGLYLRLFVRNRGQERRNLQLGETERRVYSNVLLG